MEANDPLAEVEQILEAEFSKVQEKQKYILHYVRKMTGTDLKTATEICGRYEEAVTSYAAMLGVEPEAFVEKLPNDRRLVLLGMVAGAHLCGKVLSFVRPDAA